VGGLERMGEGMPLMAKPRAPQLEAPQTGAPQPARKTG
jgi:hypothetical protein